MAKKRRKKSILKSRFYQIYFLLVLLALVGIGVGTAWLLGVLGDYESAQPVYTAKEVARLFEASDYGALYDVDTSAAQIAEGDRDFYVQSLTELSAGRSVSWTEAFSPNADERRYTVSLDGERFATFTLVPSGQTTARGNRLWTLGQVTTHVALKTPEPEPEPTPAPEPETLYTCRVTAPQGYAVAADGATLGADNAQLSEKNLFEEGFLPQGVSNPVMTEYVFSTTSVTPHIAATDATGAAAEVVPSADKPLTWSCSLPQSEELRALYGDAALSLGKQVAKYIFQDASKKSIKKICADGSPAEEIFDNLGNRYTTPHDGIAFRSEQASEFYALTDACFTCHVSFEVVLSTKSGEMVYPTAYTFCVIVSEGQGRLYNMLSY